jgi:hypothetical protein
VAVTANGFDLDDSFLDRVDDALRFSAFHDNLRARVSGLVDLEFYHFTGEPPGLINTGRSDLFNPRLSLFLDAQYGPHVYFFVQSRFDRGFDPSDQGAHARLDEYALRVTPWEDGRVSLQIGKFATVAGNWIERHLSWDNPFINAPAPYENLTSVSDIEPPLSVKAFLNHNVVARYEHVPIIWGPNYANGVSVSGRVDKFEYAIELKNAALASRPQAWEITNQGFNDPTVTGHAAYRPNEMWKFGISASEGAYLGSEAGARLPSGRDVGDYREFVVGQDISFAWHHWQLWAEFYEARFQVPRVGDADIFAYYIEAKYKFAPQLFGAVRWNQELFGTVPDGRGGETQWGNDLGRVDAAIGYRLTPHSQLKIQYSVSHTSKVSADHTIAAQFTVRF